MVKSNAVCPVNPLRIVSLACANSSIFPLVRCHLCLEHLIECSGCLPNVVHLVTEPRWFRARCICHSLPRINSSDGFTPFSSQIRNLFFCQFTPLHMAAEGGRVSIMKFLVDKGAKIDVKENFGVSV